MKLHRGEQCEERTSSLDKFVITAQSLQLLERFGDYYED